MDLFRFIARFLVALVTGNRPKRRVLRPDPNADMYKRWEDGADVPDDSINTVVTPAIMEESLPTADTIATNSNRYTFFTSLSSAEKDIMSGEEGYSNGKYLWLLDNGHAKLTPGKRSPVLEDGRQFFEYEFSRDIVRRIIRGLDILGYHYACLVLEDEIDVPVEERLERAEGIDSNLPKFLISVHANAAGNGGWSDEDGVECWFSAMNRGSMSLASAFHRNLLIQTRFRDRGIKFHYPYEKGFFLLRRGSMPAALTECGFYTHEEEVKKLLDPAWRQKIAKAHIDAIHEVETHTIDKVVTYSYIRKVEKY